MYISFAVKLGSLDLRNSLNWWIIKKKKEFDNIFDERNIYILLFNLRHVIHIPSVRIFNLLCCGGHFSNIIFIDAQTKYRSPYLLNVSSSYL